MLPRRRARWNLAVACFTRDPTTSDAAFQTIAASTTQGPRMALGIAVGVGVGAALGAALNNIAIGIALGAAVGHFSKRW